jgi:hypothetical protein
MIIFFLRIRKFSAILLNMFSVPLSCNSSSYTVPLYVTLSTEIFFFWHFNCTFFLGSIILYSALSSLFHLVVYLNSEFIHLFICILFEVFVHVLFNFGDNSKYSFELHA